MTKYFRLIILIGGSLPLFHAGNGMAADEAYERILLPITSADTAGAFGAIWTTELWFRNDSDSPTVLFPVTLSDYTAPIKSTSPLPIFRPPANLAPGQFIYVTREVADKIRFSIRVRDASRDDDSSGAEIPVVREESFFHDRVVLINVPVDAALRAALRIYGSPGSDDLHIRVQIFDESDKATTVPIADQLLRLGGREPRLYNPPYAHVLSLTDTFPGLRAVERVRIEISTDDTAVSLWAFVTLTSNSTNAITTVTPQ